ncbi:hypothetical protein KCP76_25760 [Salmonella enterica subsp. enterica serovar Weltevreden]|nr:hypothetical protein KCP76_25760 [Salmonella enterica subsp. enterica serovar Weltevreden]
MVERLLSLFLRLSSSLSPVRPEVHGHAQRANPCRLEARFNDTTKAAGVQGCKTVCKLYRRTVCRSRQAFVPCWSEKT